MHHARDNKKEANKKISRRGFLKLGFTGISGAALLFLSACAGEDDDGDGRSRRRRRRR